MRVTAIKTSSYLKFWIIRLLPVLANVTPRHVIMTCSWEVGVQKTQVHLLKYGCESKFSVSFKGTRGTGCQILAKVPLSPPAVEL